MHDHFKPVYVISSDRKKIVAELKAALKQVDELYLATDEDREGEAIAWHLQEVLNPKVPVKRMVFHEITPAAIAKAVEETRDLDLRLVDAQEGRRFLDRLVGYEVSPVLWRAVDKARSAGRVQSVAIRLVCERERERMDFTSATWFDVTANLDAQGSAFDATLESVDGSSLATGKNFDAAGVLDARAQVRVLAPGVGHVDRRALARRDGHGDVGRLDPSHAAPPASVHDVVAADRGEPQTSLRPGTNDARGPATLRTGLDHLHAHRLDDPVGRGDPRGARDGGGDVRRRLRGRRPAALRPQGEERPRGPRGDPAGRGVVPLARRGVRPNSGETNWPSTT